MAISSEGLDIFPQAFAPAKISHYMVSYCDNPLHNYYDHPFTICIYESSSFMFQVTLFSTAKKKVSCTGHVRVRKKMKSF